VYGVRSASLILKRGDSWAEAGRKVWFADPKVAVACV